MNLKVLFFIIKNIIHGYLKNPLLFAISLLAPTLFGMMTFGLVRTEADRFPPIGFVSQNSSAVVEVLKKTASLDGKIQMVDLKMDNYAVALKEKKVNAVVIIPVDFDKEIISNPMLKIKVISVAGDQTGTWVEANLQGLMANISQFSLFANGNSDTFYKVFNDFKNVPKAINVITTDDISSKRQEEVSGIGMLSWIIFMMCALYTVRIISDRENNTLRRISATRANGRIFVTANILAAVFLAFLQVSVAVFTLYFVFGFLKYIPIIGFFLVLFSFAIASIAIGTFTATISKSSLNNILLVVMGSSLLSMIGGLYWPIDITPDFMQKLSFFTPQGWLMDSFTKMGSGKEWLSVIPDVLILLAFAVTFITAASYALSRRSSKGI